MGKVIGLIRTSTIQQEVETQKEEVLSMIKSDGYTDDEIIIVGGSGASAIKMDNQYMKNINTVYDLIEKENIQGVYVWGIDRIGRNEELLMGFKNRLIRNKVQLVIKNPSLRLLNDDGSVNTGVELAFSLFATMSKQEMETKMARFERGKRRNMENQKWTGGMLPLGYTTDKNGFIIINEEERKLVDLIFNLFTSGKYSTQSLAKELNSRGYRSKLGNEFNNRSITVILKNKSYTGSYVDEKGRTHKFPTIISEEVFNKVAPILKSNNIKQTKITKHNYFGIKLITCECGYNFVATKNTYTCAGRLFRNRVGYQHLCHCNNTTSVCFNNFDGILWELTKEFLLEEIKSDNSTMEIEMKEQISVLNEKKMVLEKKLSLYDKKIEEIVEKADRELRSEEYINKRVANVSKQRDIENKELVKINDELNRLEDNLKFSSSFQKWFTGYNSISDVELRGNEKEMKDLVHRYISNINIERITFDNRPNYNKIDIKTHKGLFTIYYHGKDVKNRRCFIKRPDKKELELFKYEKIIRDSEVITTSSNERFKVFRNEIEKLVPTSSSITDIEHQIKGSDGVLPTLYSEVLSDNRKRVEQYLNEVSVRITEQGKWIGKTGVVSKVVYDTTDKSEDEEKILDKASSDGLERIVKKTLKKEVGN